MSLVRKYEPGGKSPILIYRGNDLIDLDAFADAARKELNLALMQLSDKEGAAVLNYFLKLLLGMYDSKVTYKSGGGWDNDLGLSYDPTNKKADRALGIASGLLGKAFRDLAAYVELKDPSEIYNGPSDIGTLVFEDVIGPSGNVQYYINLDEPDKVTGKRLTKERTKKLKSAFEKYYKNPDAWKDRNATPEQISEWEKLWETHRGIFDDEEITPNEYYDLSKLFGGSVRLEDMFYTGNNLASDATKGATDALIAPGDPNYVTKEDWYKTAHPRSSTPSTSVSLDSRGKYALSVRQTLDDVLSKLTDDLLLKLVKHGINYGPDGKELNDVIPIRTAFISKHNGRSVFDNAYITSRALEILRSNNRLVQFTTDANSYYIPIEDSDRLNQTSTGLVYKISPSGSNSVVLMDRNDIPYFTSQWDKDYFTVYKPATGQGGS